MNAPGPGQFSSVIIFNNLITPCILTASFVFVCLVVQTLVCSRWYGILEFNVPLDTV